MLIIILSIFWSFPCPLSAQTTNEYYVKGVTAYVYEKKPEEALKYLKKALKIDPSHASSLKLYQYISQEKMKKSKTEKKLAPKSPKPSPEVSRKEPLEKKEEGIKEPEREEGIAEKTPEIKDKKGVTKSVLPETKENALTLYDCLKITLDKDPRLRRQEQEIRIRTSRHQAIEKNGGRWPSLDLNLTYSPASEELRPKGPWVDVRNDYSALLSLYYEIYPMLRTRPTRIKQAKATTVIEKSRYLELRRDVIDEVATAFYGILEREEAVRISEDTIHEISNHLESVQKRYELGSAPKIEALRSANELLAAKEELRRDLFDLERNRLHLQRLLEYGSPERLEVVDSKVGLPEYKEDLNGILRRRPEIERFKESLKYAEYDQKLVRIEGHPTLSLSADYGLIGDVFPPDREAYYLRVNFRIPLLGRGPRKLRLSEYQGMTSQREIELREAWDRIKEEVELAYLRHEDLLVQLERTREEIEQRESTLLLTKGRYQTGLTTYSDVIDEIRLLGGAKKRHIATKYMVELDKIRLIQALGLDPLEYIEQK